MLKDRVDSLQKQRELSEYIEKVKSEREDLIHKLMQKMSDMRLLNANFHAWHGWLVTQRKLRKSIVAFQKNNRNRAFSSVDFTRSVKSRG